MTVAPAAELPPAAERPSEPDATAAASPAPAHRLTIWHLVALGLILLLATGLRVYRLGAQALWADEFLAVEQSSGWGFAHEDVPGGVALERLPDVQSLAGARPWTDIWASLQEDGHPPLYLVVLRGWREVFAPVDGPGETAALLRALSAVASVASVLLLFDLMWRLHGPRFGAAPALWACLVMALAGPQIQFAQEARSYALLTALGLGACAALVRLEKDGPGAARAAAFGACVLGMLLTHYVALGAAAALAVYAAVRLRGPARKQAAVAEVLAAAVFAVAWGPFLHAQHVDQAKPTWATSLDPHIVRHTLESLALLPTRFLNEPMRATRAVSMLAIGGYVASLLLLRRRPDLLLWVLWAGAIVALAATVDLLRTTPYVHELRYTLLAAPAVYALGSVLLADQPRAWVRHAVPAVGVLSCLISLPRAYQYYLPPKPQWHGYAAHVDRVSGPDDAIVFYGGPEDAEAHRAIAFGYARYVTSPSLRPFVFLTAPPDERVVDRLRRASGVWVVTRRDPYEVVRTFDEFAPDTAVFDAHLPPAYRMTPKPGAAGDVADAQPAASSK
jgi:uncharacterized membrane protein